VKHSLIILISILLISSTVIGHPKGEHTLYRWETFSWSPVLPSGEKWMGFGDRESHRKYTGQVENGKPNGLGILIYPEGWKHVGEWKDGKKHGHGTFTDNDGEKTVGRWENGNFIEGTVFDKYGKTIKKWENGKEIKQ